MQKNILERWLFVGCLQVMVKRSMFTELFVNLTIY